MDKLISFLPIKSKVKIDESFAEWFSGFADAEGTFIIRILEGRAVSLTFRIKLHKDDFEILYKIKNKLGMCQILWKSSSICGRKISRELDGINSYIVMEKITITKNFRLYWLF